MTLEQRAINALAREGARSGFDPVAHAVLKGSTLGAAMTLHAARTTDVSQSWLNSISG